MIKSIRDLRVINDEFFKNKKTQFLIDHSKINGINLDDDGEEDDHFFCNEKAEEDLDKFIKEEDNKKIFRKKFKFDIGDPVEDE